MARNTPPFAGFEWLIAWRYLRAKRREGGVSVMTWISLVGIALAVFALIATLSVRSGFRHEFVATILGANAHVTVYSSSYVQDDGRRSRAITNFDAITAAVAKVHGVTRVAPIIKGQVMASGGGRNVGVQIFGERLSDLQNLPLIVNPESQQGDLSRYDQGVAVGSRVAQNLGLTIGDRIKLISPEGVKTAFGTAPRVKSFEIVYIFGVGRYDIDNTRIYMPFTAAQEYFNREGTADELEILVVDPEAVNELSVDLIKAAGPRAILWTWRDASGSFLAALRSEDNIMFIILSILVLIASMNIVSGLIMLVKNKGPDVGILRTMGLSQGSIMRIFFIVGALIGLVGTTIGVAMGVLFTVYIDPVFGFVNWLLGGQTWDPSIRYLSQLPARLELADVMTAIILSLTLSFFATIFPARRAAKLNPVEALRYE